MAANSTLRPCLCRQRIRNGWTRRGGGLQLLKLKAMTAMVAMPALRAFPVCVA
jgi:hypothetical protein